MSIAYISLQETRDEDTQQKWEICHQWDTEEITPSLDTIDEDVASKVHV